MYSITTERTSAVTARIIDDFILAESQTTRKIFRAILVENPENPHASVRGYLIHQRKSSKDFWEDICEEKLSNLKSGEGIKIELTSEVLLKFNEDLCKCYSIGENGLRNGTLKYKLIEENKLDNYIEIPEARKNLIKELLDQEHSEEIWDAIVSADPNLATRLSWAKIQTDRNNALKEFEDNINNEELQEKYWQKFFTKNTWIFGYGLNYAFTSILQSQPSYGGGTYDNKGNQQGDILCHTSADVRFTVLVEIKRPDTKLIEGKYRNGCYKLGSELYGAVAQVQTNLNTWNIEGSRIPKNIKSLETENIYTCLPKGILIIGDSTQLKDDDEKKSFELFRRNIFNPEIITFDELLERAKFIVGDIENRGKAYDIDTDEGEEVPF